MDRFVTVATFTFPHEMAVIRARLESEGILCVAKDEFTVAANPLYSNLVGGIKLQVPAEDVERARELLGEDATSAPEVEDADVEVDPSPSNWSALSPKQLRTLAYWLIGITIVAIVLLA